MLHESRAEYSTGAFLMGSSAAWLAFFSASSSFRMSFSPAWLNSASSLPSAISSRAMSRKLSSLQRTMGRDLPEASMAARLEASTIRTFASGMTCLARRRYSLFMENSFQMNQ